MARSEVKSEIGGRVWKLEARVGDRVAEKDLVGEGQVVAVLET